MEYHIIDHAKFSKQAKLGCFYYKWRANASLCIFLLPKSSTGTKVILQYMRMTQARKDRLYPSNMSLN